MDHKPPSEDRKARYLAPLVIAAVVAAVLLVIVARQPRTPPHVTPPPPSPVVAAPAAPVLKAAPQALTRAELIDHARVLAASFAAVGKMPVTADPFVGRHFSLRIAFGCNGVSSGATGSQVSVNYDSLNQSVSLVARPGDWSALPLVQNLSDYAQIEGVEGFWLPRPWMDEGVCPARSGYFAPATPTPPTAPTLGLAQIFPANGSRVTRHSEHPYEFTRKIPAGAPDVLDHSYRLVLEGSITGFADRQALQCWVESPDHQPLCIYGVALDHVSFVDGDTGEVLANWTD